MYLIGNFSCQALCEVYSACELDITFMENPEQVFQGFYGCRRDSVPAALHGITEYCSGVQYRAWWINVLFLKSLLQNAERGTKVGLYSVNFMAR